MKALYTRHNNCLARQLCKYFYTNVSILYK